MTAKRKNYSNGIRWKVGQKFVNIDEFRNLIRIYGIDKR